MRENIFFRSTESPSISNVEVHTLLDIQPFIWNMKVWLAYDLRIEMKFGDEPIEWDAVRDDEFEDKIADVKKFIAWEMSRNYDNVNVAHFYTDIYPVHYYLYEPFLFDTYSFLEISEISTITIEFLQYIQNIVNEMIEIFSRYLVTDKVIMTDNFDQHPCPWPELRPDPDLHDFKFMYVQGRSRVVNTVPYEENELSPFNDRSKEIYGTNQFYDILKEYPWLEDEQAHIREEIISDLGISEYVYGMLLDCTDEEYSQIVPELTETYKETMKVISEMYAISIFRHDVSLDDEGPQRVETIIYDMIHRYNVLEIKGELEAASSWAYNQNIQSAQQSFEQNAQNIL
mgnify:CR=1 FL=1